MLQSLIKTKQSQVRKVPSCPSSDSCKNHPERFNNEMNTMVCPCSHRCVHCLLGSSSSLTFFFLYGLVTFQMNSHQLSLTLSASRHHTHPFMAEGKSEKGAQPSPWPKGFPRKLGLSAEAPGTLQHKNVFTHN